MSMQNVKSAESAGVGRSAPFEGGWLHGTILGVEPAREVLFLLAKETKRTLAIRWAPETQFAIEGRPSSSAELRPGQSARIHCRSARHELEADSISMAPRENHRSEEAKVIHLWSDTKESNSYGRKEEYPDC